MVILLVLLLLAYVSYRLYRHLYPAPNIDPNGKYVLISGCDTGFGHELAVELDSQGFNVFATVYREENQGTLTKKLSSRAIVFRLDVTQSAHIDAAYQIVKEKTNTLHGLINNAGIDQDGLIDWVTLDFMRNMMEVNYFGHVAMTKQFLPLLISKRGSRVINLCSVAGYLAAPCMSAYCASKFALESFSDCLRREMFPWGLHVSIVEPSYMRTPIIDGHQHRLRSIWDELSDEVKGRWGKEYFDNTLDKRTNNLFIHFAQEPIVVVRAIQHAVNSTAPEIRYRPGWQSSLFFFPLSMIPARITDVLMQTLRGRNIEPAGVRDQTR